jgi:pimeloyl-ACP methyl ester carboxylesterase
MIKELRQSHLYEINGKKLFAIKHLPLIDNCFKVVVFCHGFGGNKIGANRFFVTLSEALAQNGIAVIRFDLRGCGDSEGDFCEITLKSQIEDLQLVLQKASLEYQHIGLIGVSLGSTISLLSAPHFKSVKSLAFFAPISSQDIWIKDWQYANAHLPHLKYFEHRGRPVTRVFFEEFFDVDFEDAIKKISHLPLLHVHGDKDTVVPISQSELFKLWRKNSLSDTKFICLPNSDHGFSDDKEQKLITNDTINWFLKTL